MELFPHRQQGVPPSIADLKLYPQRQEPLEPGIIPSFVTTNLTPNSSILYNDGHDQPSGDPQSTILLRSFSELAILLEVSLQVKREGYHGKIG